MEIERWKRCCLLARACLLAGAVLYRRQPDNRVARDERCLNGPTEGRPVYIIIYPAREGQRRRHRPQEEEIPNSPPRPLTLAASCDFRLSSRGKRESRSSPMALRSLAKETSGPAACALRCRSGAGMPAAAPSLFLASVRNQVRPSRLRDIIKKKFNRSLFCLICAHLPYLIRCLPCGYTNPSTISL